MNWSVQQWKLPYEFLRIPSIFRGKFYCLSLATVAVDINVKTLKREWNSVVTICSECCRSLL